LLGETDVRYSNIDRTIDYHDSFLFVQEKFYYNNCRIHVLNSNFHTHSGGQRACAVNCYVTLVAVVHVDEGRHSESVYLGTSGCAREMESVPGRDNVAPRSLTHTCTSRMLRHLLGTECIASVSHAADLAG